MIRVERYSQLSGLLQLHLLSLGVNVQLSVIGVRVGGCDSMSFGDIQYICTVQQEQNGPQPQQATLWNAA